MTQAVRGKCFRGNLRNQVRVGTQAQPDVPLAGPRHAGILALSVEQVGDELKMHVWRPAAVDLVTANFGKRRSLRNRFTRVEASERVLAQVTVKGVEGELFALEITAAPMAPSYPRDTSFGDRLVGFQLDAGRWNQALV